MAAPGDILNIGTAAGRNHFNVGIGRNTGHTDYSPTQISGGYSDEPYFVDADGTGVWTQFRVYADGETTSANTKYPRSELREYDEANARAAWNSGSGTHYMKGISRVQQLMPKKPWCVIAQIHDSSSDLCRLQTEGTSTSNLKLVVRYTPPGGSETTVTVQSSYTVGDDIDWEWRAVNGTVTLKLDGVTVLTFSASASGCYFKAGAYAQSNVKDVGESASSFCEVWLKNLEHHHTGGGGGGGTGAGPQFGAAGALAANVGTTPITPAFPAGLTAGDLLLTLVHDHDGTTPATPTGWELVTTGTDPAGGRACLYRRFWQSGDAAPSYVSTGATGIYGVCTRWTGCHPTTPITTSAVGSGSSETLLTAPSVTTSAANSRAVYFYGHRNDYTHSAPTNGAALGFTATSIVANDAALSVAHVAVPVVGAAGATSLTATGTTTQPEYATITVALQPPAPPPGVALHQVGPLASDPIDGPITPAFPTGIVADQHYLTTQVMSRYGDTIPTPTGWEKLGERVNPASTFGGRICVFGRRYQAGDTPPTYQTGAGDGGVFGVCTSWTGVHPTDPLGAVTTAADGTNTTVSAPAVTTTQPDCRVVRFAAYDNDYSIGSPSVGSSAYSLTISSTGPDGTDQAVLFAAHEARPAAGASGTCTWAATGSGTPTRWVSVTVALRPDAIGAKTATDTATVGVTDSAAVGVVIDIVADDTVTVTVADSATQAVALGALLGTWISPPLLLPEGTLSGSQLAFSSTVPTGATITVETSTDNGATWQPGVQAGPIARLVAGTPSPRTVVARVTMTRVAATDPTPRLHMLEMRVAVSTTRDEQVPLGVFTLNDVAVNDTAGGLEIELSGSDLARKVARNRWEDTYVIPAGTNYGTAIQGVIADRLPGAVFNFASTQRVTPRLFFGEGSSNDPWQDAQDLAVSIGHELFFDARGICTLRPEPDPDIGASVWEFEDLTYPTMTSLVRRVSDEDTYNKVIATGEGSGVDVPVRAVAIDSDPASPTYFLGPYGTVTLIVRSPMILTVEQAQDAADALLRRVKGATEAVELEVVPMPAIEPGDVVTVTRGHSKVEGRFLVEQLRIPLDAEDTMRVVGRRQRL